MVVVPESSTFIADLQGGVQRDAFEYEEHVEAEDAQAHGDEYDDGESGRQRTGSMASMARYLEANHVRFHTLPLMT